ncbi:MAG: molybdenum cofactor guanylyltransferase MobA [Pseudomonadales bacterium]
MKLAAVVLAGGQGSRMQGRDKGLVEYHAKPMIEHTLKVLDDRIEQRLISCNRNLSDYLPLADTVVCDRLSGFLGPLAGVHAAMEATDADYLLVLPCDTPDLSAELVASLIDTSVSNPDCIIFLRAGEDVHPLHAVIPTSHKVALADYLIDGGRAVRRWYAQYPCHVLDIDECQAKQLRNINHLADL